jgi:hypothetical protein
LPLAEPYWTRSAEIAIEYSLFAATNYCKAPIVLEGWSPRRPPRQHPYDTEVYTWVGNKDEEIGVRQGLISV